MTASHKCSPCTSTFEFSQCRHGKERQPGPRKGFWVTSGNLSPKRPSIHTLFASPLRLVSESKPSRLKKSRNASPGESQRVPTNPPKRVKNALIETRRVENHLFFDSGDLFSTHYRESFPPAKPRLPKGPFRTKNSTDSMPLYTYVCIPP